MVNIYPITLDDTQFIEVLSGGIGRLQLKGSGFKKVTGLWIGGVAYEPKVVSDNEAYASTVKLSPGLFELRLGAAGKVYTQLICVERIYDYTT